MQQSFVSSSATLLSWRISCTWDTSMDSSRTSNRCSWRRRRRSNHNVSVPRETAARQSAYPREMGAILPPAAERQIQHARSRHPDIPKRLPQRPVASTLGIEPTEEEIGTSMKAMANAKAVGPDGLSAKLLKLGLQQDWTILLELHRLTTLIWRERKVPQQWKDAVITIL